MTKRKEKERKNERGEKVSWHKERKGKENMNDRDTEIDAEEGAEEMKSESAEAKEETGM